MPSSRNQRRTGVDIPPAFNVGATWEVLALDWNHRGQASLIDFFFLFAFCSEVETQLRDSLPDGRYLTDLNFCLNLTYVYLIDTRLDTTYVYFFFFFW